MNNIKNLRNESWKRIRFKVSTKKQHYEISNYGRIKSIHKLTKFEKILKGSTGNRGHISLNVRLKDNINDRIFIHRFVAKYFLKKPLKKQKYVLHKNYDKSHNKWTNLKWATDDQWKKHLKDDPARKDRPRDGKNYKLTEKKVIKIKKALQKGKKTKIALSRAFGVTQTQIRRIETGENWGHVSID